MVVVPPADDGGVRPQPASVVVAPVTWVKVPAGGLACPRLLSPQQARVPSVLTPQVWREPAALTSVKVPWGGIDLP